MKHLRREECQEWLGSISDYVDGTLQNELCRLLEDHMTGCEDCQAVVDTLRKTIELYREDHPEAISEEVKRRLFKRLDLEDLFAPR